MKTYAAILVVFLTGECVCAQRVEWIGSNSCATSTCHGRRIGSGEAWRHSLSTFLAQDPHATAGLVLVAPQSREIVRILDPSAVYPSKQYDLVLRKRCISCHTTATLTDCLQDTSIDRKFLAAGVSCESCHGPAGDWVDEHISSSFLTEDRRSQTSMRDTETIIGRAETCVRCHVGSRNPKEMVRDVNHDLIAAGHPALRFDLLIYDQNLPAHWDRNQPPDQNLYRSHVRTRTVSRAINLAAAAELASHRAGDFLADRSVPWPELSDYDCFACHQTLRVSPPTTSMLKVSDGLPIWNAWHTVGQIDLYGNKTLLRKLSPHQSDPRAIEASGAKLALLYRKKAEDYASKPIKLREYISSVLDEIPASPTVQTPRPAPPERGQSIYDWHHAAVIYLKLSAVVSDLGADDAKTEMLRRVLGDLELMLRFDSETDANVLKSKRYQSPVRFSSDRFQEVITKRFKPLVDSE